MQSVYIKKKINDRLSGFIFCGRKVSISGLSTLGETELQQIFHQG
jgi:hypothetical protein